MFVTSRPVVRFKTPEIQSSKKSLSIPKVVTREWSNPICVDYLSRRDPTESLLDSLRVSLANTSTCN